MSIPALNAVWQSDVGQVVLPNGKREQGVAKRAVLLALADAANARGLCRPGIAYLTGMSGVSRASVFRALNDLEDENLLQRAERRRANGSRRSNAYRINIPALLARPRTITPEEVDELEAMFDAEWDPREAPAPPAAPTPEPVDNSVPEASPAASAGEHGLTERPCVSAGRAHGLTVRPGDDASSHGETGDGLTVRPLEPPVEPTTPLTPRAAGGTGELSEQEPPAQPERCATHGRPRCRPCGLSPRVQAAQERALAEEAARSAAAVADDCRMCRQERRADDSVRWVRVIPGTQQLVTPYRTCDHVTPYRDVMAEIAAADAAAPDRPAPVQAPVEASSSRPDEWAELRSRLPRGKRPSGPRDIRRRFSRGSDADRAAALAALADVAAARARSVLDADEAASGQVTAAEPSQTSAVGG